MSRFTVAAIVLAWLVSGHAGMQDDYSRIVHEYLIGEPKAAVAKISALNATRYPDALLASDVLQSRRMLMAAAALHTEAALRGVLDGSLDGTHLWVATALVEIGEKDKLIAAGKSAQAHTLGSNSPFLLGNPAVEVGDDFRLLWYQAVITSLQYAAPMDQADAYLKHALVLYPSNADIHVLAGVGAEMRSAPRTTRPGAGTDRTSLSTAERHFRAALAAQPDRLEARLRLGRVLQQLDHLDEARTVLALLAVAADDRIAYLGQVFLGGVEDGLRHPDAALAAYDAAAARLPRAQTARLAASEVRYRLGERRAATEAIPGATGEANALEPWWTYTFGEYWRIDLLLDAIQRMAKR